MQGYVLVGGWPGSGKSTLARALAAELGWPCLAKDDVKEALMDERGAPSSAAASRRLGQEAAADVLRLACQAESAVIDSTWYLRTRALVEALGGPFVEVRCVVPVELAQERYRSRTGRDERHLDDQRTDEELWGRPVDPLGVGPVLEVDTRGSVDVAALAGAVLRLLGGDPDT